MFTNEDRKTKNWRSQKRALKTARNNVAKLQKALRAEKYETPHQKKELQDLLADAKVQVSVLELKVGDKPE